MRKRHVRRARGLARLARCVLAVAAAASFLPASTASSAEPNPRTVTVSKSAGLRGGEEITVTWTGFSPGLANVLQCNPQEPLSSLSTICVAQNRVRAVTGANGTGSATIRLRVGTSSVSPPGIRCYRGASCSVVVTECAFDVGAGRAASAPISFDELPEYDDEGNIVGDPSNLIGRNPPPPPPPPPVPILEPPPTDRPPVTGGGSGSVSLAADVWLDDIRFAPIAPAVVDYTPLNSPSGLGSQDAPDGQKGFVGGELDFALSGMPLSSEQRKELDDQKRGAVLVPLVANALTLAVNGRVGVDPAPITDLRLSATAVHDLYAGNVDRNGDQVVADNLGCQMASYLPKVFKPVYRGDQSADNLTLTSWLAVNAGVSRFAVSTRLDVNDSQYEGRQGSEALAAFNALPDENVIKLGYVGLAHAKKHGLTPVAVKNRSGAFVLPTAESVAQSFKASRLQEDGSLSFDRADPNPGAYPLSSVTYAVVPTTLTSSFTADEGAVLRDFLTYAISTQGQAKAAALGYFGLPPELLQQARDAIAKIPVSAAPATEVATESFPVADGLPAEGSGGFDDFGDAASPPSSSGEGDAALPDGATADAAAPAQAPAPTAPEQTKRLVPIGDSRLLQGGGLVPPLPLLLVLGLLLVAAGRLTSRRATSGA